MNQNIDSKQENGPAAPPTITSLGQDLQGKKLPTLIYGSNPGYVVVEKNDSEWNCTFVEDATLDNPGLVDKTYTINAQGGLQFFDGEKTNALGLYFGEFPSLTKISICGTSQCRPTTKQDLVVINMKSEQFESIFQRAKNMDASQEKITEWNLYFLDENLKTFQSANPAILKIEQEEGQKTFVLDWNGALDQTGKVPLDSNEGLELEIKSVDLKHPMLLGKLRLDDQEYRILGTEKLYITRLE